jgi:hypothetical protein
MNDHAYTFIETVKDRKSLVPSSRHRVNGSKSKRCTLPSDNLTPAERNKLNGEVKTYAIHRPMSWEAFKSMPVAHQQEHLDYIQSQFHLGLATIGPIVFSLSPPALSAHAKKIGLTAKSFKGYAPAARVNALAEWINADENQPESSDSVCPEEPEPAPKPEPPRHCFADTVLRELRLSMTGSAAQISQTLFEYLDGHDAEVEVTIKFKI